MKKLRPFYVRRWLRDFKYQHRYLHDMLKTFITMVSVTFGLFIAFIPLAISVDFQMEAALLLYFIIVPLLVGYVSYLADCFDY